MVTSPSPSGDQTDSDVAPHVRDLPAAGDIEDVYARHLLGGELDDRKLRERFRAWLAARDAQTRMDQADADARIVEDTWAYEIPSDVAQVIRNQFGTLSTDA